MGIQVTPQLGLGALCTLLFMIFFYEVWAPIPEIALPNVAPRAHAMPLAPARAASFPPAAAFAAINERPIFVADRKPLASSAAAAPADAPPPPPAVSLVGIIVDSETKLAMIKSGASPLAVAYSIGAAINGWTLGEIDPDRIVLNFGAVTDVIALASNRAPRSDRPARTQVLPPANFSAPSVRAAPDARPSIPETNQDPQ